MGFLEDGIGNQDLGTRYAHCYQGVIVSMPSQLTTMQSMNMLTHVCTFIYTYFSMYLYINIKWVDTVSSTLVFFILGWFQSSPFAFLLTAISIVKVGSTIHLSLTCLIPVYMYRASRIVTPYPHEKQLYQLKCYIQFILPLVL